MKKSGQAGRPAGPDSVTRSLRRARQALGLTTREVAARIDVSPAFITLIETGRRRPSPENARALAKVLGLPAEPLLAWLELGGGYDRKRQAARTISEYLRGEEAGQPDPEGMTRVGQSAGPVGDRLREPREPPGGPGPERRVRLSGPVGKFLSAYRPFEASRAPAFPAPPAESGDILHLMEIASANPDMAGEMVRAISSAAGRPLATVPLFAEGVDPRPTGAPAPEPDDVFAIDRALLPSDTPLEGAWACRLTARGARHVPDTLAAGDVVLLARPVWPPATGDVLAVRLEGRIELSRLAVKGDSLVVLLADGVELMRMPSADAVPAEVRGRVALVVRAATRPAGA